MIKNNFVVFVFLSLTFLCFPTKAFAYLDPGSGSFIFQVIIASLMGVGFLIKLQWSKLKNIFGRKESSDDDVDKRR